MSIQELEAQILRLNQTDRLHLLQVLTHSLNLQNASEPPTLANTIGQFRQHMSPEELDPNSKDIWQGIRDKTPDGY